MTTDAGNSVYAEVSTPKTPDVQTNKAVPLSSTFWGSLLVVLLLPFQFGWSVGQLNLTAFNDEDDCNARPVAYETCLMFPGHTKTEWTLVVNAWIVGGMVGSLVCGAISERYGRKKVLLVNAVVMLAGAVIQASTSNITVFMVGRVVAGVASGCATGMVGGYISEISPPNRRNSYGTFMQASLTAGILVVTVSFFFADTSNGWRYIAAFPILNAGFFLALASFVLVECPALLLKKEIMNGQSQKSPGFMASSTCSGRFREWRLPLIRIWSPKSRSTKVALFRCSFRRFSSNNCSSRSRCRLRNSSLGSTRCVPTFSRMQGGVIVYVLMLIPTMTVARLSERFGNRRLLLSGLAGMFISATGITLSLAFSVQTLSIVFTGTFVAAFSASVGPLIWPITAALFTDSVRATAVSMCIFINWVCNLIIGVFFPYISDALDEYKFVPFMVTTAAFFVFTQFCIPETAGKNTKEIQRTFRSRGNQKPAVSSSNHHNVRR